ncbi:MAG: energy-coupling factor transporter ATPase [Clostridiales bacterium]|nr:energy-coupling factor transporter ATPase [Clostridiales bacterium]
MAIEVKHITHIYNKNLPTQSVALSDVSFRVEDGEFLGIIGHTGSGKSTLLQHLDGLLKPDEGQILIGEVDITAPKTSLLAVRRQIGLVFQYPEYQLFDETVAADVAFGPKNLGLPKEEIEERVRESLGMVGLDYEAIRDKSPFDFSGGQKRRIAMAGVLAMRPRVLILDEPTAGLDPKAHRDVLDMIRHYHKAQSDSIIILVSHNMNDIAEYADKVLVMDSGRAVMYGTPKDVFAKSDLLRGIGLDIPDLADLAEKLKARGFDVPADAFTTAEMAQHIAARIRRGRNAVSAERGEDA